MTVVDEKRLGWLQMFEDSRDPTGFLLSFFSAKPGSVFDGEEVSIDVRRNSEDIAIPVPRGTGPNWNEASKFTNKKFIPPSYSEGTALHVNDLLNRMSGTDSFTAAYEGYAAKLMSETARTMALLSNKIDRSIEVQASQILQTGKLVLKNAAGDTVFDLDFKPKASHFPTVGTAWSDPSADAIGDIAAVNRLIRANGKVVPNMLIMGRIAMKEFLANTVVKAQLDNRRMELASVAPQFAQSGATRYAQIWVESYPMDIWTYPEGFTDPQTDAFKEYVDDDKVIVMSSGARMDRASARVPVINTPDPRVAALLPGRVSAQGFDVTPNVYISENNKTLKGELESNSLLIPVQLDAFGAITT